MSEEDDKFASWLSQSMKEMADDEVGEVDPLAALQSIRQRAAEAEQSRASGWGWFRLPTLAFGMAAAGAALTFFWLQGSTPRLPDQGPEVAAVDEVHDSESETDQDFGGLQPGEVILEEEEEDDAELAALDAAEEDAEPVHTLAEPTLLAMDMVDVEEIDAADELVPVVFRSDESTTFLWFEGETKEL